MTRIVVHFESDGEQFQATVEPGSRVTGIFLSPDGGKRTDFSKANSLKLVRARPRRSDVTIRDARGDEVTVDKAREGRRCPDHREPA